MKKNQNDRLYIDSVKWNKDGSMIVICRITADGLLTEQRCDLEVNQGTAIVYDKDISKEKALVAIINENTKLTFKLNKQFLMIDGRALHSEKEDLWKRN
ncbi:MAG: hypothetical protein VB012_00235 [Erysipelotrichaceae bacterium]|nr:hypothetical protein [Erysipelotrichaceae bacterium]